MPKIKYLSFFVFLFTPVLAIASGDPILSARAALLMDATTGTVLYEKNADLPIAPASLTKLMTIHIALEEVNQGLYNLNDTVSLPKATWGSSQPEGSSLMFLAPGQIVTLHELLLGLAVSSGNDAAIAVAIHSAGSVAAFVRKMNACASALGLISTHFVEPSGISERNRTSARDFAVFCRFYLSSHPNSLKDYHSVSEFAYPKVENVAEAYRDRPGTIVQKNRNGLLDSKLGVDGLKTGFIIESGFHFALTALRAETRLIAVLLGIPNSSEGAKQREEDGRKLLDWGFAHFKTLRPNVPVIEAQRVWKGQSDHVALELSDPANFTISVERGGLITYEIIRRQSVTAPIFKGDILADLVFSDEVGELRRLPLIAAGDIPAGPWYKRFWHSVVMFFLKLFNARAL